MKALLLLCFLLINPSNLLTTNLRYDYSTIRYISKNENREYSTLTSISPDETAIYISSEEAELAIEITISETTINKKSGDSSNIEDSDLYGLNSAVLIQGVGDYCYLRDTEITTNAKGANAIFSTNHAESCFSWITKKGAITTHGDYSRGLISTFFGLVGGTDITITTNGEFSSAMEINEQGGGYCYRCTLTTNGKNSPLFKTKGNNDKDKDEDDESWGRLLRVKTTTGLAMKSKIANVEGANSVSITEKSIMKCGANPTKDNNNFDQGGIMLYQSGSRFISGNSFSCQDSTLEILKTSQYYDTAPMFFVTNIGTNISLINCQFKYGSNTFINLKATEGWGEKGANGGDANIYLTNQTIEGDFIADGFSSFYLNLKNSSIKGTINGANTAKNVTITLDLNSKIEITGNSYATLLTNEKRDGSNLINGTYKWTISKSSAEIIFSSKFIILSQSLILSILLL